MRRLVDSILFLLIAYTVTWPVVRGFVARPAQRADLLIEVHGDVVPGAMLLVAPDEGSASRRDWSARIQTTRESPMALLQGLGDAQQVWVSVEQEGVASSPRPIDVERSAGSPRVIVDLPFDADDDRSHHGK